MDKMKNIVEIFISLIKTQNQRMNDSVNSKNNLEENLSLINKSFRDEEIDNFKILNELLPDEFEKLMAILLKDNEENLKRNIEASCFLMKNDIELVEEQIERLEDLRYRASIKKRDIKRSIDEKIEQLQKIEEGTVLISKLEDIVNYGFLDNDTIFEVFEMLNLTEEDKLECIDDIINLNLERINSLNINMDSEIETLDFVNEKIETMTEESLFGLLQKYGYDSTMLDKKLVNLLINEGNLEHFNKVLDSLSRNRIDFMKEKSPKNAQLLTKFLLESSDKIIDEVCGLFSGSLLNKDIIKNYMVVFFKSPDEKLKDEIKRRRESNNPRGDKPPKAEGLFNVAGKHKDFIENLKLLENYGYDRKTLLENCVRLLTMSHSLVKRNIRELQLYEYPFGAMDFPLSTVCSSNIMDVTDGFIEVGEGDYIYKYSSKLTSYIDCTLKRIYALKQKGLPYKIDYGSKDKLLGVVSNPNVSCGITDDEVEKIIPRDVEKILKGNRYKELIERYSPSEISNTTLEEPFIKELDEKYMVEPRCYNFNGVLISRRKFLRNYEFLMETDLIPTSEKNLSQILWTSALFNSKLNAEQIEKVSNAIDGCMVVGGNNGISKK